MLTNSVCPSGLNVEPANSSPNRVGNGAMLLTRRLRAMLNSCAAPGQPAQVVVADVVLADDQRAAGAGGDVVREVQRLLARATGRAPAAGATACRSAQIWPNPLPNPSAIGPVLASAGAAALGGAEVDDPVVVGRALEAGEVRRALGPALVADVVQRRVVGGRRGLPVGVRERRRRVVDVHPLDVVGRARRLRGGQVGVRLRPSPRSICSRPPSRSRSARRAGRARASGAAAAGTGRSRTGSRSCPRSGRARRPRGSNATDSWANRPALRDRLAAGRPVDRHLEDEAVRLASAACWTLR